MNDIYTGEFVINNYLIFPRSMLKLGLNATETAVYMLLLDRAKLSAQKGGWTDEMGYVYLFYPILSLARDLDRGETAVRTALQRLRPPMSSVKMPPQLSKRRDAPRRTRPGTASAGSFSTPDIRPPDRRFSALRPPGTRRPDHRKSDTK